MSKFHWTVPLTVAACLMGGPARADRFNEVVVVTHVDVDPQNVGIAEPLLIGFVEQSRTDPGVKSFTLITQDPTTNHFQLIEVFRDMRVRCPCQHRRHDNVSHQTATAPRRSL